MRSAYSSSTAGKLQDRISVVTGAGRGIGRAVAKLFVEEGADVLAVARMRADLESLAREAERCAGRIVVCPGSVTDRVFVEGLFRRIDEEFGTLDILINSAGIAPFDSIFDMDPEAFRACLELNVWAVFLCTKAALRIMRGKGRGRIINIGSVRSHWTEAGDAGAYNTSKYGLRGFTESVARELHGQGLEIAVGMVCPGAVDTPLTNPAGEPKPDWLRPETVAQSVLHAVTAPANVNVFDTTLFTTWQKPW